ncbi:gastric triacylglycerol lipase [Strongylocentrotus purpuratus]|uniref:Lipase n=1 Tax=Strongylocentrotus purpuratus TaxID=7668 RepID=A0A7M7RFU9_STRPU|nr:gastric triacylglycerol lipase [Strongylocentrotus purpuratus]|eukprot:XP_791420.1 PREDICTED: gastric triacylglycerol lipase [Strongylocentrotus purpuratus]
MAVGAQKPLLVLSILSLIGAIAGFRLDNLLYRRLGEDPDVNRNASQLITSKGYPCKEYSVQTDDGFILGVQRIPYGRNESKYTPRPVVFLQHGLLASSTNWLTNLANESLAYILADAGFDVWLGNVRGNDYSKRSIKYKPEQVEFWKWSWDEMAKFDLPAMLGLALKETNQPDLFYIGHSQGTTIAFAEFSRNFELAAKVKMMYALAPVARVSHMTSPLHYLTYFLPEIQFLFDILGEGEFNPSNEFVKWLARDLCPIEETICSNVLFVICGYDEKNLNMSRLPVYFNHDPSGTSVMDVVHYAQMVDSGTFQMYDYGYTDNMAKYNQSTPPLYIPENMATPVSIFWGKNDWLADPEDVQWLIPKLNKVLQGNYQFDDYDHLDFIWGMDAPSRVYAPIIEDLKKRSNMTL